MRSLLWASFMLSAYAQNNLGYLGPNKPGRSSTPEAEAVFQAAGRQPNATNSVSFTRTFNNTEETWSWRINITDFAVPSQIEDLGTQDADFSEGLRNTNIQWQINWPGDSETLESFLQERNMSMRFNFLVSNKPSEILDRYNDNDNGDCTSLLNEQCTQSLTDAASQDTDPLSFSGLDGCDTSFDLGAPGIGGGTSYEISLANSNSSTTPPPATNRTSTLFYYTTTPYPAANTTLYNRALSAVQVFIIRPQYGPEPRGDSTGATVLCRVVDRDAGGEGDGEGQEDDQGAGVRLAGGMGWVWSAVGVMGVWLLLL